MTENIIKYSMYLFILVLGIILGITIRHYYNIPIAETINIIDVATLVVTIFLAVYIPEVLDRKLQIKREHKKIIGERVEELHALYRKTNQLIQRGSLSEQDDHELKHILDICQHRLNTIAILFTHANLKISFTGDIDALTHICQQYKQLFLNNAIPYSAETQKQEECLFNEIDKIACLLIFKLSDV